MQYAAILAIGNELLIGDIIDTNSNLIQKKLYNYNIRVQKVVVLPDKLEILAKEIENLIVENYDYLFITGGLGPTEDDLTRKAISTATKKPLEKNETELNRIKEIFNKRMREFSENNINQAYFPKSSEILVNNSGTASAFKMDIGNMTMFSFPGVPSEIEDIWNNHVVNILDKKNGKMTTDNRLIMKFFNIAEAKVDKTIMDNKMLPKDTEYAITSSLRGNTVKLTFLADINENELINLKKQTLENFINVFTKSYYATDNQNIEDIIADMLIKNKLTISTAESCTGGMIASMFTDKAGSSEYFIGSAVTYSNESKMNVLSVKEDTLLNYGAVSKETLDEMLIGCHQVFNTDLTIAVTGIAGPLGGSDEKPVGTVYIGVSYKNNKKYLTHNIFGGSRKQIRERTCYMALFLLYKLGKENNWIL